MSSMRIIKGKSMTHHITEPAYHDWDYDGYIEDGDTEYKFRARIVHTGDYLIDNIEVYDFLWDDKNTELTKRAELKAAAKFNQTYR